MPKLFVATKAFIMHDGKVLVLRESAKYQDGTNIGKYDLVGGKVNPGEHFLDALKREVREETGLTVTIGRPFFVNEWRPMVKGEELQIVGIFFECKAETTDVRLSADHDDYQWVDPRQYKEFSVIDNIHKVFAAYLELHP